MYSGLLANWLNSLSLLFLLRKVLQLVFSKNLVKICHIKIVHDFSQILFLNETKQNIPNRLGGDKRV